MTRADWSKRRLAILDAAERWCGYCAGAIAEGARFNVVLRGRYFTPMHVGCRLRFDAPTRLAKALATRRARRAQLNLPSVSMRRRAA